jgi:hypothetical protein
VRVTACGHCWALLDGEAGGTAGFASVCAKRRGPRSEDAATPGAVACRRPSGARGFGGCGPGFQVHSARTTAHAQPTARQRHANGCGRGLQKKRARKSLDGMARQRHTNGTLNKTLTAH